MTSFSHPAPAVWSEAHFSGAELPDHRLRRRVVKMAEEMARHPGWSLPRLFPLPKDLKAAYRLLSHESATPEALQSGHRDQTRAAMMRAPVVLLPEDTTTLSWSGNRAVKGLGPVGRGEEGLQGFLLHTTLAVAWPREDAAAAAAGSRRPPVECLGIAHQISHVRTGRPPDEAKDDKRARLERERESQFWERTSAAIGPAPEGVIWRRVSDRESDIYEYLLSCDEMGHGFVVRACQDRCLREPAEDHLFSAARSAPELGRLELELRGRDGMAGRTARLVVQSRELTLAPPGAWKAKRRYRPLPCVVVRVFEPEPPKEAEALEWVLLTDAPTRGDERAWASTLDGAIEATRQYATRWLVEDFHKAIKSGGMKAEQLQLESADALRAAVAMMSVTALRLVELRERVRRLPDAAAEHSSLSAVELTVLRAATERAILTVREVALAIGHLGGHLNRKSDGMPGVLTLWRGMEQLTALATGFQLANRLYGYG